MSSKHKPNSFIGRINTWLDARFPNWGFPRPTGYLSRLPIAFKITAWYSAFLLLMIILLSLFVVKITHIWADSDIRQELQEEVILIADRPNRFKPYHDGVFIAIYSDDGIIIRGTLPDGFPKDVLPSLNRITELKGEQQLFFYYDVRLSPSAGFPGVVRGVVNMDLINKQSNNMLFALISGGLGFLLLASFGGYLLIHRGLRPIREVTETAMEIGRKRDLSRRIPNIVDSNDELSALSSTFNHMLSNLEEASNREKQFNSDVSHELRTPIAVIQAESDYGKSYTASVEEAKESFERIFKTSKLMTTMVSQLLEIARLDNMNQIEKEVFDLTQLLRDISEHYQILGHERSITFSSAISQSMKVKGNLLLLRQSVTNLLDNAFKFTTDSVELQAYKKGGTVAIHVIDNGPGIPEAELQKIWNRMYQVDSSRTSKPNKGLGLGLYFVQNVMKLHDGTYTVDSIPHKQTTFTLEFPTVDERG